MFSNFRRSLKEVLRWEGGYVNHPKDPGGATNRGVTQAVYNDYLRDGGLPIQSVRNITEEEVADIYHRRYWNAVGADRLPTGVDYATFDYGVNSGPSRALRYLGKSMKKGDSVATIKALCSSRMGFLRGIGTFAVFGKGWGRRVASVEATAVKWALQDGAKAPETVRYGLLSEARAADRAAGSGKKAAGIGTAGGGGVGVGGGSPDLSTPEIYLLIGLGILVVIIVLVAIYYWKKHKVRAQAYKEVANATG